VGATFAGPAVLEFADGKHGRQGSCIGWLKAMWKRARWLPELEALCLWGMGGIDSVRAPVLRAGGVFKF
jgi:hypothetical protein